MVVALSYYGISYSAGSIGDDLFVSNILIALVGKKLLPESNSTAKNKSNPTYALRSFINCAGMFEFHFL